jgi:hypothetical protein
MPVVAEPLVPDPSHFKLEIVISKLNAYRSSGTDKIAAEMKHYVLRSTHPLILFGIRKNCLGSGVRLLLYQFTRVIKLTNN